MGVRVKLRICTESRCIETSALVNSGFESLEPEIVIPIALADALGIEVSNSIATYEVAGGGSVAAFRAREQVRVGLVLDDRPCPQIPAVASIMPGEHEVIVSDRLAHDLGIVIIDPFEGLWCLRDEIGRKVRHSVPPQHWR